MCAARAHGAIRFRLGGMLLTPISVMLRATAADDLAARMWQVVDRELGEDGWYEADCGREIWYFNVVHFGGPIERPQALVDWVDARAHLDVGEITVVIADLVRWEFDGRRMTPTALAAAPLTD